MMSLHKMYVNAENGVFRRVDTIYLILCSMQRHEKGTASGNVWKWIGRWHVFYL